MKIDGKDWLELVSYSQKNLIRQTSFILWQKKPIWMLLIVSALFIDVTNR